MTITARAAHHNARLRRLRAVRYRMRLNGVPRHTVGRCWPPPVRGATLPAQPRSGWLTEPSGQGRRSDDETW